MIEKLPPSFNELALRAHSRYDATYPYHDWGHAEDVMRIVADIADRSIDPAVKASRDMLVIAAAWHDADYHLEDLGQYVSKEQRSAELAVRMLPELTDEQRQLIHGGIIDTTVHIHPKSSMFGEILHAADVGYFADETDRFMERLRLMRKEWGSPDWKTTIERTVAFGDVVVKETQPLMEKILSPQDARQWVSNIKQNLTYLQMRFNENLPNPVSEKAE